MTGSFTKQRTYDRETFNRARDAWDRGRFGSVWADWRGLAGKAGIIFPPDGTAEDSWSDPRPSQRALIYRAIVETPRLLRWALTRPGIVSWGDVIEHLLAGRDRMALEADEREAEWTLEKVRRGAPQHISGTLAAVVDSLS